MKKITQIQISNYRAFYNKMPNKSYINEDISTNDNIIKLKNGENVLIYGENGSGKSSLFHALKDFFESASTGNVDFATQLNIFVKDEPDFPISQVSVYFNNFEGTPATIEEKDPNEPIVLSANPTTTKAENDFLKEASQAFLSYRDMLKTYFLEDEKSGSPDLFDLFINRFLGKNALSDGTIIKDNLDFIELKLQTLNIAIHDLINDGIDEEDAKETLISSILTKIEGFNEMLYTTLEPVIRKINQFLKNKEDGGYFNANFEITPPENYPFLILDGENLKQSLKFKIKYFNEPIEDTSYHHFLNEARLSALAICIYLVAIKEEKPTADKYKILFLDDIFIGLDMSNRLPLLEILKNEFSDYQIFITTYDRSWFEVAKQWLETKDKDNWKFMEMYVGKNELLGFEYPLIYSPSLSHYEKAKIYANRNHDARYKDKFLDYASAGNHLRKEVEKFLKGYLLKEYRYIENDKGEFLLRKELQQLWDMFKLQINRLKLSLTDYSDFPILSKSVFNPLSHDNWENPIFKTELEKAFLFVDKLYSLSTAKLFEKGKKILLPINHKGTNRIYILNSEDDAFVFTQGDKKVSTIEIQTFVCAEYVEKGEKKRLDKQYSGTIKKLFNNAYFEFSEKEIKNASDGIKMLEIYTDENGKSLQTLIDEL